MSYHGKLQVLKNGTADAEIQVWAFNQLTVSDINFENAERIIRERESEIAILKAEVRRFYMAWNLAENELEKLLAKAQEK